MLALSHAVATNTSMIVSFLWISLFIAFSCLIHFHSVRDNSIHVNKYINGTAIVYSSGGDKFKRSDPNVIITSSSTLTPTPKPIVDYLSTPMELRINNNKDNCTFYFTLETCLEKSIVNRLQCVWCSALRVCTSVNRASECPNEAYCKRLYFTFGPMESGAGFTNQKIASMHGMLLAQAYHGVIVMPKFFTRPKAVIHKTDAVYLNFSELFSFPKFSEAMCLFLIYVYDYSVDKSACFVETLPPLALQAKRSPGWAVGNIDWAVFRYIPRTYQEWNGRIQRHLGSQEIILEYPFASYSAQTEISLKLYRSLLCSFYLKDSASLLVETMLSNLLKLNVEASGRNNFTKPVYFALHLRVEADVQVGHFERRITNLESLLRTLIRFRSVNINYNVAPDRIPLYLATGVTKVFLTCKISADKFPFNKSNLSECIGADNHWTATLLVAEKSWICGNLKPISLGAKKNEIVNLCPVETRYLWSICIEFHCIFKQDMLDSSLLQGITSTFDVGGSLDGDMLFHSTVAFLTSWSSLDWVVALQRQYNNVRANIFYDFDTSGTKVESLDSLSRKDVPPGHVFGRQIFPDAVYSLH